MLSSEITGQQLVEAGLVSQNGLDFLKLQRERLLNTGVRKSLVELAIENSLVKKSQLKIINAAESSSDSVEYLDIVLCEELGVRPVRIIDDATLLIETSRPLTNTQKSKLTRYLKNHQGRISGFKTRPGDLKDVLNWIKNNTASKDGLSSVAIQLNADPKNSALIKSFIEAMYQSALELKASDITVYRDVDPARNWVSFSIDGSNRVQVLLNEEAMSALIVRIKMLADLDISNSMNPQDGRQSYEYRSRSIDLRVATLPSVNGEKVTIRLLDPENLMTLDETFFAYPQILERVKSLTNISKGLGGLVLVTGATGSGKTTTMYSMIQDIDRTTCHVMTAEDPVELQMPLTYQTQINPLAGLGFAEVLTAQLRSNPDILLVGELRDTKTAEIAIRSAETGHTVFTSLHTDDAPSSVNRLMSMMSSEYAPIGRKAIANNLMAVINLRLAKRLCSCSTEALHDETSQEEREFYKLDAEQTVYKACGCKHCGGTGYKGRVLMPEAIFLKSKKTLSHQTHDAIERGAITREFVEHSNDVDFFSLRDSCKQVIELGLIDFKEANRIMGR